MNDFDQSFLEFQAGQQARRCAEYWLAALETALVSHDVALICALFATGLPLAGYPGLHMAPDGGRGPT